MSSPSGAIWGLSSKGWKCMSTATSSCNRATAASSDCNPIAHQGQETSDTKSIFILTATTSPPDGDVNVAVAEPADLQRNLRVLDGLGAHVRARAVVDLLVRSLVYSQHHHDPAALLQLAAGHALAVDDELLPLAGLQKMAVHTILRIAGADLGNGRG